MVNLHKIEELIKENGWSKSEFFRRLGTSHTMMRDWKTGRSSPEKHLHQIATLLNTTPEYLRDETDVKEKPAFESGMTKELYEILTQLSPESRQQIGNLAQRLRDIEQGQK